MSFDPTDPHNELYARPPEYWKVFVSSKMAGGAFRAERAVAVEAIDDFPLTRAWAWERDAAAGPYCSEPECVRQAGTSDVLVLIVGGDLTPITRKEYEAAYAAGVPIVVLLQSGADRDAEVDSFVALARERGVTVNFSSTGELASQITRAIRTWALRSGRSELLRARESRKAAEPAKSSRKFEDVELGFVEESQTVRIGDLLAEAERHVQDGHPDQAAELIWKVAQGAWDEGLGSLALQLFDALERLVPADALSQRWQGWILNTRGLALSRAERHEDATAAFARMRQIGRALGDRDLESTALQNLAVQDVVSGRHVQARQRLIDSAALKSDLGDWYGGLQVLFNLPNVLVGEGKLEAADDLLDDLEELLKGIRDPLLRNTLHGQRGSVAVARGDFLSARQHYTKALAAARRARSTPREIVTLQNLGSTAVDLGRPKDAVRWYTKSVELAEQVDDLAQRRRQRQALALALMRSGRPTDAAELFERAAGEAAELGDRHGEAVALGDAGACWLQASEPIRAVTLMKRALAAPGGHDDDSWRTGQLLNLAAALEDSGDHSAALERTLEAANLAPAADEQASALRRAGELSLAHPSLAPRALEIFERELTLRRNYEPGDRWGWRAAEIGATLIHTSQTAGAAGFFSIALRVFAARKDQRQVFFIRNDRAVAAAELNELRAAATDLRACLTIAEALDDRALRQQAHMNLGETERRRGHHTSAANHLQAALGLAQDLEDLRAEADTEALLGLLADDTDEDEVAEQHLRRTEHLGQLLADPSVRAAGLKGRAHLAFRRGRYRDAALRWRRAAELLRRGNPVQRAESLSGLVVSRAWLGQLDEQAIEELVELSEYLAWDRRLLEELEQAFQGLSRAGAVADKVELLSLQLVVAVRLAVRLSENEESLDPLARASIIAATWFGTTPEEREGRRQAVDAAVERIAGSEVGELVGRMLDQAERALEDHLMEDPAAK